MQAESADEPIYFAAVADGRVFPGLVAMAASVMSNLDARRRAHLTVISLGLSAEQRADLQTALAPFGERAALSIHDFDDAQLSSLQENDRLPRAVYAKFFAPEYAPAEAERLILIDTDILVNRDLAELDGRPQERPLAAVLEPHNKLDPDFCQRHGYPADFPYFNSGFVCFHLPQWRDGHHREALIELSRAHAANFPCLDQDAFNLHFLGNFEVLDGCWNDVQPFSERRRVHPRHNLHIAESLKPWHFARRHGTDKVRLFYHYIDQSGLQWENAPGHLYEPPHALHRMAARMLKRLKLK